MPTLGDFEIAQLDAALAEDGEDVIIRRVVGVNTQVNIDVKCRAFVRKYAPQDLVDTIIQGDSTVIISSTQIIAEQWPGGRPVRPPIPMPDPRVPQSGDKVIIQGWPRTIKATAPIYLSGQLIRIDMQVTG